MHTGVKWSIYPKIQIKTSFLTKFTFSKPHFSQNSHFQSTYHFSQKFKHQIRITYSHFPGPNFLPLSLYPFLYWSSVIWPFSTNSDKTITVWRVPGSTVPTDPKWIITTKIRWRNRGDMRKCWRPWLSCFSFVTVFAWWPFPLIFGCTRWTHFVRSLGRDRRIQYGSMSSSPSITTWRLSIVVGISWFTPSLGPNSDGFWRKLLVFGGIQTRPLSWWKSTEKISSKKTWLLLKKPYKLLF